MSVNNEAFDCGFRTGYVYAEHVTLGGTPNRGGGDSSLCQFSWEEKPGTTDYTAYDEYRGRTYPGDRPHSETLIGSGAQSGRTLCEKARVLKHCFDRVVLNSDESAARRFRQWGEASGVDPVLALMAKTEQETKMGTLRDSCGGGSCNGIGLAQVITAIDRNGIQLSVSDPRWDGITFNILTNLEYSVRVVAEKIPGSNSLYDLAYYYNGSAGAASYASNVVNFYSRLKSCGL